jgi:hypothetical protein
VLIHTRWQLAVTRLGILAFKIAIIVILILAVVTPVTGGLKINMPEMQNDIWTFDNGTLRLGMKLDVYNGAMFDVNDFYVNFRMTDANMSQLVQSSSDHMNIRSGQWNNLDLRLAVDLESMNQTVLRSFVFNATQVQIIVDGGATYPLGWVALNVGGNSTYDWKPLVQDYGIDVNKATLSKNGAQYSLSVPYYINVSSTIIGQQIELKLTMRNDSGTIAMSDQMIVLQSNTKGNLALNISSQAAMELMAHQEQLHFDVQVGFMNVTTDKTVDYLWSP